MPSFSEVSSLPRGSHAALLYTGTDELCAELGAFFARGLDLGERCVLACEDEMFAEQARRQFELAGIPVASAERSGALLFLTHDESYYVGGRFDPASMLQLLRDSVAGALDDGFAGLRGAGEGSWLPSTPEDEPAWCWYEREVSQILAQGSATALCCYSLERFPAHLLLEALDSHSLIVHASRVMTTPERAAADALNPALELRRRLGAVGARA